MGRNRVFQIKLVFFVFFLFAQYVSLSLVFFSSVLLSLFPARGKLPSPQEREKNKFVSLSFPPTRLLFLSACGPSTSDPSFLMLLSKLLLSLLRPSLSQLCLYSKWIGGKRVLDDS